MKHIFVTNPMAGQGKATEIVYSKLSTLQSGIDSEIYLTKGKGDAEAYIKDYLSTHSEATRFYACGGDGTVNEVVNGVVAFPHGSFTVYPCGSGNDFVKCFGTAEEFLDINALVNGEEIPIDVMRVNDRYCINICHFGFDTCVAEKMNEVRDKKFIGGRNAYTTGVVYGLAKAMKSKATIIADGEKMNNGVFMLCTVANGQYVGGKYRCAPRAEVNDGWLDVCLVDPVSRLKFVKLVSAYADGQHLDDPRFSSFVHYKRCRRVEIIGNKDFKISLDGEVIPAPHALAEIIPNGIKIALPKSCLTKVNSSVKVKSAVSAIF